MMRSFLFLVGVAAVGAMLLTGCNSRARRPTGTAPFDAGMTPRDAGEDTRTDGRVITVDAGTRDSGMVVGCTPGSCPGRQVCISGSCQPECDGTRPCTPPLMCIAGECSSVSPPCRTFDTARVIGAYCSAATQACTDGCTTGTCIDSCLAADPNPDCDGCAGANIGRCVARSGCATEWNCVNACGEDMCPVGSAADCVTTRCGTQLAAWQTCAEAVAPGTACGTEWTYCF
jgi:hypothetical protein